MAGRAHTVREPQSDAKNAPQKGEKGNGLGGVVQSVQAADTFYVVNFNALNDSGLSGGALLAVDDNGTPENLSDDTLTVVIAATGLEPNQVHIQHIHGVDGTEAVTPPPSSDTDGDTFIELAEGLPFYGPILLNLTSPQGSGLDGFPTAQDGSIFFAASYHLHPNPTDTDHSGYASGDVINNFADLDEYEIVLHGMTVGVLGAGTPGEVDGSAGYKLVLPIASGVIEPLSTVNGVSAFAHLRNAFDGHGPDRTDWMA